MKRSSCLRACPRRAAARLKFGRSWCLTDTSHLEKPVNMNGDAASSVQGQSVREQIDALYRSDSRRVLATLIRRLGGFDAAEEAMHDAFTAALDSWPAE